MPSPNSSTDSAPDASRTGGDAATPPERATAALVRDPVAAPALTADALAGDLAHEALFWRARAEELAARLTQLEERLGALAARLPARWAQLLVCDPAELPDRVVHAPDPLAGWRETTELSPARVAAVLPRLWDRLEPDAS